MENKAEILGCICEDDVLVFLFFLWIFACFLTTVVNPRLCLSGLRKVMVRAHRQAWCWQDEWYGLTIEDIRQLELETQLALAKKMGHYSQNEEGGTETSGYSVSQDRDPGSEATGSTAEAEGGKLGDSLESRRELTKQWSTSSRSSNRSSKRGGEDQFGL